MKNLIDLHIHSTASDGSFTPTQIVETALKTGLRAIAITDHDTLGGLAEGEYAAQKHNLEFIRGCEISTRYHAYDIHIIGLYIPKNLDAYPQFLEAMKIFHNSRVIRNEKICAKFQELGLPVYFDNLTQFVTANYSDTKSHNENFTMSIGRPHIAQYLIQLGIVQSTQEAFEKYLASGKKAYVTRQTIDAIKVIKLLKEIGAICVLAHPALIPCTKSDLTSIIQDFKEAGLHALEAYHSAHSSYDERVLVELAHKNQLLLSGGSDFHGASRSTIKIGKGKGSLRVPYFVLEKLKALICNK